ncbi:hypothetical protein KP509_01G023600 [Ceratopteris richardii]|uniref:Pentatricopeptide repeat-containing protein n=1 Tax=Ceratopteris richardii TaxID=49495 RepID=A0A8T2VJG1_CERRI|nr:hypothetical protein KP509_01G023600 [Ceratopteris richardii]
MDYDFDKEEETCNHNGKESRNEDCTYTSLLKACSHSRNFQRGIEIHAETVRRGLFQRNVFISSSVVNFYAKCSLIAKAREAFSNILVRNVVSWNALIVGYAQQNQGDGALTSFDRMQCEGIIPNSVTFASIIKACGSIGAIHKGQNLHAQVHKDRVLLEDSMVNNSLIDMYAKCGLLTKSHDLLDSLPVQSVVGWTALIAGYAQHGHRQKALDCYVHMRLKGLNPNAVTLLCVLKACGDLCFAHRCQQIHAEILKAGLLEKEIVIGTALVDTYANCGQLKRAEEVFDELPARNVVSWTALIAGYAQQGHDAKAFKCYEQMLLSGLPPNLVTVVCVLKACSNLGMVNKGQEIHDQVRENGLFCKEIVVANAVIEMYAKCNMLQKAQEVLDGLPIRNEVSWNVLMCGYVQHGDDEQAMMCYDRMQKESISPDAITYSCILKACANLKAVDIGCQIHEQIQKDGLLGSNIILANALVDMYAKCGMLTKAQKVHDYLPIRSVVSFNALILGYVQCGLGEKALDCFDKMQSEGHSPDGITITCVLKACGNIGALQKGEEVHAMFAKDRVLEEDIAIANALVDMYVKCGALVKAQEVFDELPVRSVISYTTVIAGYAQHGHCKEALSCFERLEHEDIFPDAFMLACTLKACGYIGAANLGQDIYSRIVKDGLLKEDITVGTALIDFYMKCGLFEKAQIVFDGLQVRNASIWNAMIGGYAQLGKYECVFRLFDEMTKEGEKPDVITFTTLLNICCHKGLVEEGQAYFKLMSREHGIAPMAEHHNCMVDLYCRAGYFDKAVMLINKMPLPTNHVVWHTLLSTCRSWGNIGLARWAFEHAIKLNRHDATAYACMSAIYAEAGMEDSVKEVECLRIQKLTFKHSITEGVHTLLYNTLPCCFSFLFELLFVCTLPLKYLFLLNKKGRCFICRCNFPIVSMLVAFVF